MSKISGNIVDVVNGEIFAGTITFEGGAITGVSRDDAVYETYIIPPFIDAHVHVESSMLVPSSFARAAVVHGTGACVSDPHEIANVLGMDGIKFMLENAAKTPFRFFFGVPSCVPATDFETASGRITSDDVKELFRDSRIKYLSEMMNVPGVLFGDETVTTKIRYAKEAGRPTDGHSPMLMGNDLNRYVGAGITTDHEAVSLEEGRAKIALGMKIQIREGSAAKNFEALWPLIDEAPDMCMLCSDDLHPDNLVKGHINLLVKRAVAHGADVMNVLKAACVNPVRHYGLDCGLVRNGDSADFIEVSDLKSFNVIKTYIKGEPCAEKGLSLLKTCKTEHVNRFCASVKKTEDFRVPFRGETDVITVTDGQLVTGRMKWTPEEEGGFAKPDAENGIITLAVVNRYEDAAPALAFVKNMGIKQGAFASSVAHDSHNIICAGCDAESMAKAVNRVVENRGGLACVADGEILDLPLPVAGLMTDADPYETAKAYEKIDAMVKKAGSELTAPFMTLSFMALLVIPSLKLSDKGLFDGDAFRFIN